MKLEQLRSDLHAYLRKHQLVLKWNKAAKIFEKDPRHPSLHFELLEPHWRGIYSFRIDRKYRAHFFITERNTAEIFMITNHYKK